MTTEKECPFCGAPLEGVTGNACPSCGNALPGRQTSAPTLITSKPGFKNSAEVMDEVKKLIREGDAGAAAEVAGSEFDLSPEAAQTTVEQTGFDMQHMGAAVPPSQPEPNPQPAADSVYSHPEVVNAPSVEMPKNSSSARNWIIGGSIGAAIFLCLCCCLPIILMLVLFPAQRR